MHVFDAHDCDSSRHLFAPLSSPTPRPRPSLSIRLTMAYKSDPVNDLLTFSEEVGNLKNTDRRGWVFKGIQKPESVAVSIDIESTISDDDI